MKLEIEFKGVSPKLEPHLKAMVEKDIAAYPSRFPMSSATVKEVVAKKAEPPKKKSVLEKVIGR